MSSNEITPEQIRYGIIDTAAEANDWITLTSIRAEWAGYATRAQIDQALTELHRERKIQLIPESNQKTLTDADRDAALFLGGEYRHLVALPTVQ